MIHLVGAPFDRGGRGPGARLGPAALRIAGLARALGELGETVCDGGDVPVTEPPDGDGLKGWPTLRPALLSLRSAVDAALAAGDLPVVLGGDHCLGAASVGAALGRFGPDLAVLWVDAHADFNTPAASASGNLHGMPLALLTGLPSGVEGRRDDDWRAWAADALAGGEPLDPAAVAHVALRDVDRFERTRLRGYVASMHDVDRRGVEAVVAGVDDWLRARGAKKLWVSFDVDALDPVLAPGTGTAVRGGLTYREGHLMAELLHERLAAPDCPYALAGLDVVETNPLEDVRNETARVAVEWVASLFGKTILGAA